MSPSVKLGDVFGPNEANNPLSYVERPVDREFRSALSDNEYIAIVVYGTSKQGKTSLCRSQFPDKQRIFCTTDVTLEGLYKDILAGAGIKIPSGTQRQTKFNIGVPGFAQAERATGSSETAPIDISNANSVSAILSRVSPNEIIILDNFHYLNQEQQRIFSTVIRSFGDRGLKFVVLGTWQDKNYLEGFNTDLNGRIKSVSIEPWTDFHLDSVFDNGEPHLNIRFIPHVRRALIFHSHGSVSILQKLIKELLRSYDVLDWQRKRVDISDSTSVASVVEVVSDQLFNQVVNHLRVIAEIGGNWLDNRTRMYWVLKAFVESSKEEITEGMHLQTLLDRTQALVDRRYPGRVKLTSRELSRLIRGELLPQQIKQFQTPILAYESRSDKLIVLDSWTKCVLVASRAKIINEF